MPYGNCSDRRCINKSVFFSGAGGYLNSAIATASLMLAMNLSLFQYPSFSALYSSNMSGVFGKLAPARTASDSVSRKNPPRCSIKSCPLPLFRLNDRLVSRSPCPLLAFICVEDALVVVNDNELLEEFCIGWRCSCSFVARRRRRQVCFMEDLHVSRNSFLWATTSSCSWPSTYAPFLWLVGWNLSLRNHRVAVWTPMLRGRLGGRSLDGNSSLLTHWQTPEQPDWVHLFSQHSLEPTWLPGNEGSPHWIGRFSDTCLSLHLWISHHSQKTPFCILESSSR